MLTPRIWVQSLLPAATTPLTQATAFAASNMALCKYWGKRDAVWNLPVTASLSVSLGHKGTTTTVAQGEGRYDQVIFNGTVLVPTAAQSVRIQQYLDLFRPDPGFRYRIITQNNVPTAAGLASSASGFAALVLALNQFHQWQLDTKTLSLLARLGSGSACRSVAQGFVLWQAGTQADGSDSYAVPLPRVWPDLCMGFLVVATHEKSVSSREAMQRTVRTSPAYAQWPERVYRDLRCLIMAIEHQDMALLGATAEAHAMAMHAMLQLAHPPMSYTLAATTGVRAGVYRLRRQHHGVYFTQDAGPNLIVLFLEKDRHAVVTEFPHCEVIRPFLS